MRGAPGGAGAAHMQAINTSIEYVSPNNLAAQASRVENTNRLFSRSVVTAVLDRAGSLQKFLLTILI